MWIEKALLDIAKWRKINCWIIHLNDSSITAFTDGLASKGICYQAWWPEFNPLVVLCSPHTYEWHRYVSVCTHAHTHNATHRYTHLHIKISTHYLWKQWWVEKEFHFFFILQCLYICYGVLCNPGWPQIQTQSIAKELLIPPTSTT